MKLFRYPRPTLRLLCFAVAIALSGNAIAADESEAVAVTVATFHESLQRGDGASAMKLLAPDAIILEGGSVETRAEYESHHLAADMAFARAVPSTRSGVQVQVDGNTAWLKSVSRSEGTFQDRPVNSSGAELVVLTKTPDGWRIRAIHWSSRKLTKPESK